MLRRKGDFGRDHANVYTQTSGKRDLLGASMARAPAKSNPVLVHTIEALRLASRTQAAPIWRALAERLEGSRKHWSEVNLSGLARHSKQGELVAVPGVLLGTGALAHPVTVAAFHISHAARSKVEAAGGKVLDLLELAKEHPKGSGVRILG